MIFEMLRISPAGDRHVLARLGDDATVDANFLSLSLAAAIEASGIDGISDLVPSYNSVLVQYDFEMLSFRDLGRELVRLYDALPPISDMVIESRLVRIPVFYGDPWTRECIEDYRAKVAQREYDPDFVARVNNLDSAEAVYARHSGCEQWVVTVSSFPGLPILRALDRKCEVISPKYNPPRTWTPVGSIGVGGTSTSIYTIPSPGGYNLIGRTPAPVWDPHQSLPALKDTAILLKAADRVRFIPIGRDEFDEISASVSEGRYVHEIEPGTFSVRAYHESRSSL
ncbi:MAG: allophanate hydrolase subunit 1 [Rhizobiales bacterium]|nr:allophanate hydrolase subunit 1 [Hyphomicrobiales bacterium]